MKTKYLAVSVAVILGFAMSSPKAEAVVPPPDGGYPGFTTAEGTNALKNLTTGVANTANGWYSLFTNSSGSYNTGVGAGTLIFNNGEQNTATGVAALLSNTTGTGNTATGVAALLSNTTASDNTAIGSGALFANTGGENTATGAGALSNNTISGSNTADGFSALFSNATGNANTAIGHNALFTSTDGDNNTAVGQAALYNNTTGDVNVAIGYFALGANTTGGANVAVGSNAGANATNGFNNVYIGAGMNGVAGESNSCYIASIFGQSIASGTQVYINSANRLGTITSSKRFKEDIKEMGTASQALFSLKPVSFRYKKEIDPAGTSQLGLVAEDVEKVNPDLVVRDNQGKPNTVRYDHVNAMLLNEFLKEHRKVEQLEKQVEALASGLQKLSAQIEMSKAAPQVVENKR